MILLINIKSLVLIFLCVTCTLNEKVQSTRCQNILEKNGQCTKCPSSKFLYKGDCYNKIRGCQDYVSDKICLSCQSGYVFNEGSCIKEAIFFRLQKADIPPVKINIEGELSYKDIEERIGESRKTMFELINRHFMDKYTLNISSCTINNVKYIETINGVIFTVYYRSMMKIYEAVAFIDSKRDSKRNKTISELQFAQKNIVPSYSLEEINSGLKKKYENMLKDCLVSSIQKMSENRYKISYVHSKGHKYECLFTKQPFEQINELKQVQNPIDMEDILAYIFNIYPDLKSLDFQLISAPFFESNTNDGVYSIVFGEKIQIKISLEKGVFDLLSYKNLSLQETDSQPIVEKSQPIGSLIGGYSTFQDLTDPIFMEVWKYFVTQYSKYQQYEITSVEYQIVAGTNFLIRMKSPHQVTPSEHVQTLIFYSLSGPIKVLQLQVEGQIVDLNENNYQQSMEKQRSLQNIKISSQQVYDYRKDSEFTEAYRFMLSSLKIVNTVPIIQVKRLDSEQCVEYQIVYNEKQKAKVRKLKNNSKNSKKETNKFQIIYYLADGTDLVTGKKISLQINQKNKVADFVKSQKPEIFKNFLVNKFKQTEKGFDLKLLVSTGVYNAEVSLSSSEMHLTSLIQISPASCYQFTISQFSNSTDVSQVDEFLKANYGMSGSVLELFQIQMKQTSKRYRVIYIDKDGKKIQVLLESYFGKLIVVQSFILEDGYVSLAMGDQRIVPVEAISRIHFGQFIKTCEIRSRLTNQTHFKLIYSCPNKAFKYIFYPNKKTDKLQVIYQESESDNHSEVHKTDSIDLKVAIQDKKFNDIDSIARTKFVEYIQTSQVTDVEKKEVEDSEGKQCFSYKLYYRSSLGHYICEARWTNGDIRILNFYLSTSQTNKNCQVLDEKTAVCIKCLPNHQLEFGKCYQQIESCLTQTGNVCVQCDLRTLLKGGKCLRNCDEAFQLRSANKIGG